METPADQADPDQSTTATGDAPAATATQQQPPAAPGGKKMRLVALAAALAGVIFGGTVEYFVGGALDATGWFGPTLDTIVEQQSRNFADIRAKLDELRQATPGSPEAIRLQSELETLIGEQEKLTYRTHDELRNYEKQLTELKAQALRAAGATSSVDFWLKAGESITVGQRDNVFAVQTVYSSYVSVVASGKRANLRPGEFVEFPSDQGTYKVFYKHAPPREDGRVGFDVVSPGR